MDADTPVPYDQSLQELLETNAIEAVRNGQTFSFECPSTEAYNAALWFAMKYGFTYDWDVAASRFTIHPLA